MALKTNFTDDILAESMNGKRQYNVTENSNGTKSLEDVTDYQSIGSTFSAKNMNETNAAVNQAYDDMGDEFNKNTKYLAGAVKIHNNKLWKFKVDHDPGEWDESQVRKTTLLDEIGELNENMQNRFKIMKFQLPPDTTANTKVYTATESDLMDYFPVGISTYVKSDTDSFWINNAEHVQQVLLRADGIYITLKSTYLVNQWARLLLCRYPT